MVSPPLPTLKVNPAFAWLLVFLPALGYFLSTRLSSGFWSELGETVTADLLLRLGDESSKACTALSETFYLTASAAARCTTSSEPFTTTSVELNYPLQLVQDAGLQGVVDILWRHDSEMGRGYLLLSESAGKGRIWRWEVGGGPIAIGKTLHLEDSGCRSGNYKDCSSSPDDTVGSGALAMDFYRAANPSDRASEGLLVVAEWGEGRIVRLEDTGARTPLLMHVPCQTCGAAEREEASVEKCYQRLPNPERMLFTTKGDLIVAINHNGSRECRTDDASVEQSSAGSASTAALIQLPYAVHVKQLHSLQESRQAHAWNDVQHNRTASVLYTDPSVYRIGGMAVTLTSLYLTAAKQIEDGSVTIVVLEISIEEEDDDDELAESDVKNPTPSDAKVIFNLAEYAPGSQQPGALAVGQSGRFFVAVQDGVLILDGTLGVLGKLVVPAPTAVTLGGDGYLYIASSARLYRIRTKDKPVKLPTNRVARPPKSTTA